MGRQPTTEHLESAEVVHSLQVKGVREWGVSGIEKYSKRTEVVHGLQVKGVREGGVSRIGKPLKSAEVAQGLQVRGVREVSVRPLSHSFHIFLSPAIN